MRSTRRFYLIPLIFALVLILAVVLILPSPRRLAALAASTAAPTAPPAEESAAPVTAVPTAAPEEAKEAVAAPATTPEAASAPSPAPETEPPETEPPEDVPPGRGPVTIDGKTYLADGAGGLVSPGEGLHDWDGFTYYFFADGSIAVSQVISLEEDSYAFDSMGRRLTPLRAAVETSEIGKTAEQLVLAVDHDLSFWEKGEDGAWRLRLETYCGYGRNGLTPGRERVMGSKTTPIGAFPLTLAFGTGENPGTEMTYRQITENSYWSEVEDETFNTWVESETPVPGEHLADYYQYKYAVNIGFNLEDIVYSRGCAIFLHVKSKDSWDTAGCVSLSEEDMLTLLCSLRDGAYIIIVSDLASLFKY